MRINIYGAPGIGKTTLVHYLVYNLVKNGINIEHVQEVAKIYAYKKEELNIHLQFKIFSQQYIREYELLKHNVNIITDSPLALNAYYNYYNVMEQVRHFETVFPGVHILCKKGNFAYNKTGRYEEHEHIENHLIQYLKDDFFNKYLIEYYECPLLEDHYEGILNYVNSKICNKCRSEPWL